MSVGVLTLLMFGVMVFVLMLGLPISFGLGALGVIFAYFLIGPPALHILVGRAWQITQDFIVVCIPLFIMMGMLLQRSGIAEALFTMIRKWAGRVRGALAAGTVLICMMFAAMTGLSGTATLTMGLVALPEMLNRGYKKGISLGSISAGGALGILIPPSVTMVFFALVAQTSVGKMFIGGIIPGILLGSLFIVYILIRSALQPDLAPASPPEERANWGERFSSLRGVILPILIILAILGSIFLGIATPTEAAALGLLMTFIATAINRQLNWPVVKGAAYTAIRVSAMGMWIYLGSFMFANIYIALGAREFVEGILLGVPGGNWGVIIAMQLIWIVLGMFMDIWGIVMITAPLFVPIVRDLGFDVTWFGVLFIVNVEMAYLTPPFGVNLFYLKAVVPPGITMADLYKSVWPFVIIQLIVLLLVMLFPQLVLWLPNLMWGPK